MGYHVARIPKGVFGDASKIEEEFLEFRDAVEQQNPLMALHELSDLIGAAEAFAAKFNMTLEDLLIMKEATKRAFLDGSRK